jgi:ribosome recycling factor
MATRKCISRNCKLWLEEAKINIEKSRNNYKHKLAKLEHARLRCTSKKIARLEEQIKMTKLFIKHLKLNKRAELANCKQMYCK